MMIDSLGAKFKIVIVSFPLWYVPVIRESLNEEELRFLDSTYLAQLVLDYAPLRAPVKHIAGRA